MGYREYNERPEFARFDIGERVLVNYEQSIFNGETGIVKTILVDDDQLRYFVIFDDGSSDEFTESMLTTSKEEA